MAIFPDHNGHGLEVLLRVQGRIKRLEGGQGTRNLEDRLMDRSVDKSVDRSPP